jgi:predicted Zn-dependent protease
MKKHMITFGILVLFILVLPILAYAVEVDKEGQSLINQARQAYSGDMTGRPVVTDKAVRGYVEKVALSLVPTGKRPPNGVNINLTVLESEMPELYSYVDGHIVITTGAVFAVDNESQLAALLSHEVSHLVEGHYITLYQQIKARERREKSKAVAGAIFGVLLDSAVDYAVEVESAKQADRILEGDATYKEMAKSMAKISAVEGTYYGMKDVIDNIPEKDGSGEWIDPRQRFEVVADAQGMVYLAGAGYDVGEAEKGWRNVQKIRSAHARQREQAMGQFGSQVREMESMMRLMMPRLRQSMGQTGLIQTISEAPVARADLVGSFTGLKEVKAAAKGKKPRKGTKSYLSFLKKTILPKAERALADEEYDAAKPYFRTLYDKGVRTSRVLYGLGKSSLGDFAFGASPKEKKEAEKLYLEAAKRDSKFAAPYRALGELYEDWERYGDAVKAYTRYLKRAPKAKDRRRVEGKISKLKRKAGR